MNKYLAVVIDSFREALASRVMWLVLGGITLVLAGLAPVGYREVLTTRFGQDDLRRPDDFLRALQAAGRQEQRTPARHLWSLLDSKVQRQLETITIPPRESPFEYLGLLRSVTTAIDRELPRATFYEPEAWRGVPLDSLEGRELRRRRDGQASANTPLTEVETARLHRLLLEAAFPEAIRTSPPTSVQFTYAGFEAASPLPLRGTSVRDSLQTIASALLDFLIGAVGVFVAILLTAPIIPQMFDAGSLHLLLSKPISRSLLFLAKFCGGCAFILIGAAYLILGLWLILGARLGVWEAKLLYSIPVYLFVFSIYYAVSSLTAVIWRSAVVSVAMSVLFWLICFAVGAAEGLFERAVLTKDRFVRLSYAGDELFAFDECGWGKRWDGTTQSWKETFVLPAQRQSRVILALAPAVPRELRATGPVYDPPGERLIAAVPDFPPTRVQLAVATRQDHWEPVTPTTAPLGTFALLREPTGSILSVASLGLQRLSPGPLTKPAPLEVFGLKIPLPGGGPWQSVTVSPQLLLSHPADAAVEPTTGTVVVYSRGLVRVLRPEGKQFRVAQELKLDGPESQPAVVAATGELVIAGREDGRLQLWDAVQGSLVSETSPEGRSPPRFLEVSPDGKSVAAVFHSGYLWLLDVATRTWHRPDAIGQGSISAGNFSATNRLLVADRTDRVSEYQVSPWQVVQRHSPRSGLLLNVYRYGLHPLYVLFPKPGELDTTFDYLLSGKTTEKTDRDSDLGSAQTVRDPWTPLWTSALFTVVVLGISCWYLERQDL